MLVLTVNKDLKETQVTEDPMVSKGQMVTMVSLAHKDHKDLLVTKVTSEQTVLAEPKA
jgi:hypothetical protein